MRRPGCCRPSSPSATSRAAILPRCARATSAWCVRAWRTPPSSGSRTARRRWPRASELCKCDLLTSMVGEFPELQGIMGSYYARADEETAEVAQAIREHYLPRAAGDGLPATHTGIAVAIADKLDTLAGIFAIGERPSGNKDPFGLRRAALGVQRILIEKDLELDLSA